MISATTSSHHLHSDTQSQLTTMDCHFFLMNSVVRFTCIFLLYFHLYAFSVLYWFASSLFLIFIVFIHSFYSFPLLCQCLLRQHPQLFLSVQTSFFLHFYISTSRVSTIIHRHDVDTYIASFLQATRHSFKTSKPALWCSSPVFIACSNECKMFACFLRRFCSIRLCLIACYVWWVIWRIHVFSIVFPFPL